MKYILILNSGSSSLKVKIFEAKKLTEVISAQVERVGLTRSFLVYKQGRKNIKVNFNSGIRDHHYALKEIIRVLPDQIYRQIKLVGHRLIHGGEEFIEPILLNKSVLKQISRYNNFAPYHNPYSIKTIFGAMAEFSRIRQAGVFDTQYFKNLAEHIYLFSIPIKYYENYGIRKFGFHGLSHETMVRVAQRKFNKNKLNLITCHIGNGISISAIKGGQVIDTSLGLTPLAGPTMGTRSGDLDPYIPLFMVKELKLTPDQAYLELHQESGLKGICGLSDFRDVMYLAGGRVPEYQSAIKRTKHKKELAKLALRIYIYDLQRYVACYAGLLGRVEAVVFSGGVGEHRQEIRQAVMEGVHFINKPRVLIVPANEELLIAEKIRKFM